MTKWRIKEVGCSDGNVWYIPQWKCFSGGKMQRRVGKQSRLDTLFKQEDLLVSSMSHTQRHTNMYHLKMTHIGCNSNQPRNYK